MQLHYHKLIHICNDNSGIVVFPVLVDLLSTLTDRCARNNDKDEKRTFHYRPCGFPADLEMR